MTAKLGNLVGFPRNDVRTGARVHTIRNSLFVRSDQTMSEDDHSASYETLIAIDLLMSKPEGLKTQPQYLARSHFKASIKLSRKKLNKY